MRDNMASIMSMRSALSTGSVMSFLEPSCDELVGHGVVAIAWIYADVDIDYDSFIFDVCW